MTTLIAYQKRNPDSVLLAGDTRATSYVAEDLHHGKFRRKGPYVFGVAGLYAFLGEVEDLSDLPEPVDDFTESFVRREVAPLLKSAEDALLDRLGVIPPNKSHYRSQVLLTHTPSGRVFLVEDGHVSPAPHNGVICIGSGSDTAYGYLSSVRKITPKHLKRAIDLAIARDPYSGGRVEVFKASP